MSMYEEMGPADDAPPPPPPTFDQKGAYPIVADAPLREGDEQLDLESAEVGLKKAKEKAINMANKGKAELEKKPNRHKMILLVVAGVFFVSLTIVAVSALVLVSLIIAKVI